MPTTIKLQNYFGLTAEQAQIENARALILPVSYESTVKGAKDGPKAVFEASQDLELFDDELWVEPYKIGIQSAPTLKVEACDEETENPFSEITSAVKPVIEGDRFPVMVGGERAITIGAVNACTDKYPNLSVLMLGARADLRSEVDGNPHARGTTGYALYTALKNQSITQLGVRNVSWQEVAWMEEEQPSINIFWARNQEKWDAAEILAGLSENVYLSIDLSVLDPSIMPATANAEPGGMSWYQLLQILKHLCVKRNVVGADITGLTPIKGMTAPNALTAKLLYKLIGYKFALDLGVSKKYL